MGLVRPLARISAGALPARTYTDAAHRVFVSRRRVRFREMEYAVPREAAPEVLRELHEGGVVGTYDAAIVTKDADGKVHVHKHEKPTQHGAWTGAGAATGLPPVNFSSRYSAVILSSELDGTLAAVMPNSLALARAGLTSGMGAPM